MGKIFRYKWEVLFGVLGVVNLYLLPLASMARYAAAGWDVTDALMAAGLFQVPGGWLAAGFLYGLGTPRGRELWAEAITAALCLPLALYGPVTGRGLVKLPMTLGICAVGACLAAAGKWLGGAARGLVGRIGSFWRKHRGGTA